MLLTEAATHLSAISSAIGCVTGFRRKDNTKPRNDEGSGTAGLSEGRLTMLGVVGSLGAVGSLGEVVVLVVVDPVGVAAGAGSAGAVGVAAGSATAGISTVLVRLVRMALSISALRASGVISS